MTLPVLVSFTKMHGLGNDFVVINALHTPYTFSYTQLKLLADRHFGIGCDQILLIEVSRKADIFCRIFNADGSEAEQCGNGLRCVARYVYENGLIVNPHFKIETKAGLFPVVVKSDNEVAVTFSIPDMALQTITLEAPASGDITLYTLSLGNPHAITQVAQLDPDVIAIDGHALSTHTHFPQGANVGFMQIVDKHHVKLATFERGAGLTHACGSNACATAIVGILNGWLAHEVQVEYAYGSLNVHWQGPSHPLTMTGPTSEVFSGTIFLS